jgi:hypothetical protein
MKLKNQESDKPYLDYGGQVYAIDVDKFMERIQVKIKGLDESEDDDVDIEGDC